MCSEPWDRHMVVRMSDAQGLGLDWGWQVEGGGSKGKGTVGDRLPAHPGTGGPYRPVGTC